MARMTAARSEPALPEDDDRYALALEAVAEGIYDWNIETSSLWVSAKLLEMFGFAAGALSAADWNARVHPDDLPIYRATLRDCFRGKTARLRCEYRVRLDSGDWRWIEDNGLPVRGATGRAIRLVGAVTDTTERKQAEQALRASEERHAVAMQAINEAVYEWDVATGEMYYSPRLHEALGIKPEQLRTRADWFDRIHPDDVPTYRAVLIAHLKGDTQRFECEYRYRHPNGHWHWARQHGLALRDASGRAYRMTGSTGDITAEKTLAQELDRSRRQLHDAIEGLSEGFALFDAQDRLLICNSRYARLFEDGGDVKISLGMTFETLMREALAHGMYPLAAPDPEGWLAALLEQRRQDRGTREQQVTGSVWLQISDHRTEDGSLVSVYTDITELKRRQYELEQAKDAAEKALGELKAAQASLVQAEKMASLGQLTAGIAHEIKNPLNFVNNFAGLSVELLDELKETAAPVLAQLDQTARAEIDEVVEMLTGNLEKIGEHGRRADGIVRSMLAHSRGGSGERQSADLNALVEEALN
ncbi:MAG: PAS domain-containing protein, partial [Alphaproteobacteria bacterium]|nr:PAS domain-containing protein [Alphaproteobacteria bacterium]